MKSWPDNNDTLDVRTSKDRAVSTAIIQHLVSTGPFAGWKEEQAEFEILMVSCHVHIFIVIPDVSKQKKDPIAVWTAFKSIPEVAELAKFAITLLKIVVNQAGCERAFSDLKIKQTQHRS
jgi:hypothetical protein